MRTRRTGYNWNPDLERVELLDDNGAPLGDVWFERRPASPSSASPPSTNPGENAPAPSSVPVFVLAIVLSLIAATLAGRLPSLRCTRSALDSRADRSNAPTGGPRRFGSQ